MAHFGHTADETGVLRKLPLLLWKIALLAKENSAPTEEVVRAFIATLREQREHLSAESVSFYKQRLAKLAPGALEQISLMQHERAGERVLSPEQLTEKMPWSLNLCFDRAWRTRAW